MFFSPYVSVDVTPYALPAPRHPLPFTVHRTYALSQINSVSEQLQPITNYDNRFLTVLCPSGPLSSSSSNPTENNYVNVPRISVLNYLEHRALTDSIILDLLFIWDGISLDCFICTQIITCKSFREHLVSPTDLQYLFLITQGVLDGTI